MTETTVTTEITLRPVFRAWDGNPLTKGAPTGVEVHVEKETRTEYRNDDGVVVATSPANRSSAPITDAQKAMTVAEVLAEFGFA